MSLRIQPTKLPQNCDDLAEGEDVDALGFGYHVSPNQLWKFCKLGQASLKTFACELNESLKWDAIYTEAFICTARSKEYVMTGGDSGNLGETSENPFQIQSNFVCFRFLVINFRCLVGAC